MGRREETGHDLVGNGHVGREAWGMLAGGRNRVGPALLLGYGTAVLGLRKRGGRVGRGREAGRLGQKPRRREK